jgi:hypothetical protein
MKITTYQLESNPDIGFSINEERGKKEVALWLDECEGGEAYESDWTFLSDFEDKKAALSYIITTYGKVKKLQIY